MRTSDSIEALALALSKAQAAIEPARKDSVNAYFRSKYADLGEVWAACRKPITDNGLSVVQTVGTYRETFVVPMTAKNKEGVVTGTRDVVFQWLTITTRLLHSSAQWIEDDISLPIEAEAQALGRVTTYLRRYALMAILGIAAEDDDGESAREAGPLGAAIDRGAQVAPAPPTRPVQRTQPPAAPSTPTAPTPAPFNRQAAVLAISEGFDALGISSLEDRRVWTQRQCPMIPTDSRAWQPQHFEEVAAALTRAVRESLSNQPEQPREEA